MQCPKCKEEMLEDLVAVSKYKELVEIILKCPQCGAVYFGTLYETEKKKENRKLLAGAEMSSPG